VSRRSAALFACVFAALAALVAAGAFTRLDQWSIDHLMPGGSFRHVPGSLANGLVPLLHAGWGSGYAIAANIVTLPASFLLALAIVAFCSRVLAVALVAAVGVEVICKELLTRPALYQGSYHIAAFDSSFPSGHTLRTVLVAAAVSLRWPRVRPLAIAWTIASLALLILAGWHTPSDLAGGVVLAALALLGARGAGALRRCRLPRGA
jgi:membrane-associated phospholipid phosphatase